MAQPRRGSRGPNRTGNDRSRGAGRDGGFRTETKVWHDPLLKQAGARGGTQPVPEAVLPVVEERRPVVVKRVARIIAVPLPSSDPKEQERQRLLGRMLTAEGRLAVTRAVDEFLARGHALPQVQGVWLQVLEHRDEARVAEAIERLQMILAEVPVERRAMLESRLRRIEAFAEEPSTRAAAGGLWRFLQAKASESAAPSLPDDSDELSVTS